jgi:hypothetical protein
LKIEYVNTTNLVKKKKEILPEMIDKIFAVCKNDPNFHMKSKIEGIEKTSESIIVRLDKQKVLLKNGEEMEKNLLNKIDILDNNIFNMKSKLLESLGSEI